MPNQFGQEKISDASTFSGTYPDETGSSAGKTAVAGWADPNSPNYGMKYVAESLQGVPAPTQVKISGTGIEQLAGPQQFFVALSLSGTETVQIAPAMTNSANESVSPVSPNTSFNFVYTSRNINVATVNSSGLVTAVGRGECEILISAARTANLPYTNAQPPAGIQGAEVAASLIVSR